MQAECYPISTLPGTTALFRDYAERDNAALRRWYPADPFTLEWTKHSPSLNHAHRERLAAALLEQAGVFGAESAAISNIEKLRSGAAAVVTGQQVGLFGGPLLTLLKAATAIRKAQDATRVSGREHVPVFWMATEDHDFAEIDHVVLPSKTEAETLRLKLHVSKPFPVGGLTIPGATAEERKQVEDLIVQASDLLGWASICDLLRECYAPGKTLAQAFGRLISRIFAAQGLVVLDAATRKFHALGADVMRTAIEHADELETALIARSEELVSAGYHAQVLVAPGHSLLFLLEAGTGIRQPLRRLGDGEWKAGTRPYSTDDLLGILEKEPERLSPNALLRPVFQDAVLPTAAYIAGPAEIAYFAQSAVVYQRALGRVTPVLPRLSATLIEPAIANVMAAHELDIAQVWEAKTTDALAMRLGARAMPIESKRKLAAAGNAIDAELGALTEYMTAMSADLGRSAGVSASKIRYQMNRLRRMMASFELQKEASLRKHATAIALNLFPEGHLQERLLGGVWFLARYGESLPELLVQHAGQECPGHRLIQL